MGKLGYTFVMMRASIDVLRKDRELLLFPIFSGLCCLLVALSFAIPLFNSGLLDAPHGERADGHAVVYYAVLFVFYFVSYFFVIFFNSAVVACAIFRMKGGDPTLSTGFYAAMSRLPQIIGWALVAASVGLLLRIIEDRSRRVGRLVAGVLGMAWSVMTFLVVPVIVVERKGPFAAVKESAMMLRKTWGQQLVANFSFGLIFFILGLMGCVPLVIGFMAPILALKVAMISLGIFFLLVLALFQSTLQTIFQAAVYLYARDGRVPEGFDPAKLAVAMRPGGVD